MSADLDQAVVECKARCFAALFGSLASGKQTDELAADAQERYRRCLATCKRAKELAEVVVAEVVEKE